MVSCTFDVTSILESKSRIEDMNSDVMLFHVPFTAAAVSYLFWLSSCICLCGNIETSTIFK